MILHFPEPDEIAAGLINNLKNIDALPCCNYVLFVGTLDFTARQYCFKQQEGLSDQMCLRTMSHKLDSKDQILYFSIYTRWSCFAVVCSY